jgi:hypothetical protein
MGTGKSGQGLGKSVFLCLIGNPRSVTLVLWVLLFLRYIRFWMLLVFLQRAGPHSWTGSRGRWLMQARV